MTSVWSDDDFEGSQEDDNNNVNHIAFTSSLIFTDNLATRKTAEFVVTDFTENSVATNEKRSTVGTDSDSDEQSEANEETHQDA